MSMILTLELELFRIYGDSDNNGNDEGLRNDPNCNDLSVTTSNGDGKRLRNDPNPNGLTITLRTRSGRVT
jgi:hypothetical protein